MRYDNADIVSLLMQAIAGGGSGGGSAVSPTIDVVDIPGGHRLVITDAQGTKTVDVMNGQNGISPEIEVEAISGGHLITITTAEGTETFSVMDGLDGADGADGRSIVSITKTSTSGLTDTYTITYSDNTTSTYTVNNGADGQDGSDGVSPQCSITQIQGGHRLVISDAGGLHMTDIMDGEDGDDYVLTNQDKQDIADLVLADLPTWTGGSY